MCVVICTLTVRSSLRLNSKFPFHLLCRCSRDAFPSSKVVSGLAYCQQDHPWGTIGSWLLLESKPLHPFPSEMGGFHPGAGNGSLPCSYGYVHGCALLPWDVRSLHQQGVLGHSTTCQPLPYLLTSSVEAACGFQSCVAASSPKIGGAPLLCFIATVVGDRGQVRSCRDLSACCNSPSPWPACLWLSGELLVLWELRTQADKEPANGGVSLCLYLLALQAVI